MPWRRSRQLSMPSSISSPRLTVVSRARVSRAALHHPITATLVTTRPLQPLPRSSAACSTRRLQVSSAFEHSSLTFLALTIFTTPDGTNRFCGSCVSTPSKTTSSMSPLSHLSPCFGWIRWCSPGSSAPSPLSCKILQVSWTTQPNGSVSRSTLTSATTTGPGSYTWRLPSTNLFRGPFYHRVLSSDEDVDGLSSCP
jgi:hypothetical protein